MNGDERGVAVMEAIILGIVLIAPMIWLLSVLSGVHSAALATNSAVREAGAVVARSLGGPQGLDALVVDVLRNHGLKPARARLELEAPEGFVRGASVEIGLSYEVPVLDLPFLAGDIGPYVTVRSRHVTRIDPYRSR